MKGNYKVGVNKLIAARNGTFQQCGKSKDIADQREG